MNEETELGTIHVPKNKLYVVFMIVWHALCLSEERLIHFLYYIIIYNIQDY